MTWQDFWLSKEVKWPRDNMLYNLRVLKAGRGTEKNLHKFWKYQAEFLELWFDHLEAKKTAPKIRQRQRKIKMPPPPKIVKSQEVWVPEPLCWD
jgi:hypothetical protein